MSDRRARKRRREDGERSEMEDGEVTDSLAVDRQSAKSLESENLSPGKRRREEGDVEGTKEAGGDTPKRRRVERMDIDE